MAKIVEIWSTSYSCDFKIVCGQIFNRKNMKKPDSHIPASPVSFNCGWNFIKYGLLSMRDGLFYESALMKNCVGRWLAASK